LCPGIARRPGQKEGQTRYCTEVFDALLAGRSDVFSQNGEDGIIAGIFDRIGIRYRRACEFGAWDGIHFCNVRRLIQEGWEAMLIEGEATRHEQLVANYLDNPKIRSECAFVDADPAGPNSLESVFARQGLSGWVKELDFLSIDIDGLDWEILEATTLRPRLICIEVNAGHAPEVSARLPRELAQENIGQPLAVIAQIADKLGYGLLGYNGNVWLLLKEEAKAYDLTFVTPVQAYTSFLKRLKSNERTWLYLVNRGVVEPFHAFENPHLEAASLGITAPQAMWLHGIAKLRGIRRSVKQRFSVH